MGLGDAARTNWQRKYTPDGRNLDTRTMIAIEMKRS
jgi:hypothetical protein